MHLRRERGPLSRSLAERGAPSSRGRGSRGIGGRRLRELPRAARPCVGATTAPPFASGPRLLVPHAHGNAATRFHLRGALRREIGRRFERTQRERCVVEEQHSLELWQKQPQRRCNSGRAPQEIARRMRVRGQKHDAEGEDQASAAAEAGGAFPNRSTTHPKACVRPSRGGANGAPRKQTRGGGKGLSRHVRWRIEISRANACAMREAAELPLLRATTNVDACGRDASRLVVTKKATRIPPSLVDDPSDRLARARCAFPARRASIPAAARPGPAALSKSRCKGLGPRPSTVETARTRRYDCSDERKRKRKSGGEGGQAPRGRETSADGSKAGRETKIKGRGKSETRTHQAGIGREERRERTLRRMLGSRGVELALQRGGRGARENSAHALT